MTEGTFSAEIPMGSFDFVTHGEPLLALSEAVERKQVLQQTTVII